ncbi:MAG: peptidoglycan synthetase [Bacteroidetes bacterium]|nr:peptidoglycan synthetase [Bacteroidota bacterium]
MKVHLISIGGAVMHNLAMELKRLGHEVSGSDDEIFEPSKSRLASVGLLPEPMGWNADWITPELDVVILGMHARPDNPELLKAQQLGLEIQSFPEFVANHSMDKTRVVVAGSHGKTTTTAMVMHILGKQKIEFDYLVGSKLDGFELMVKLTNAPIIIIEGDEYLSSPIDRRPKFIWYKPHVAVITGIAWDHINVFPTFENYVEQFRNFIDTIEDKGSLFWFGDDEVLKELCAKNPKIKSDQYGLPEFRQEGSKSIVKYNDTNFPMQVFGNHNLANMQAAVLIAKELGVDEMDSWQSLTTFSGTSRRLEKIRDDKQLVIYRDFAHSPSKVKATVEAVRQAHENQKVVAVLELHTFSSLQKNFLPHYRDTMKKCDNAIVCCDPHVFEMKKMEVINPDEIEDAFGNVEVVSDLKTLPEIIKKHNPEVLLLMSSGNFGGIDWLSEMH